MCVYVYSLRCYLCVKTVMQSVVTIHFKFQVQDLSLWKNWMVTLFAVATYLLKHVQQSVGNRSKEVYYGHCVD